MALVEFPARTFDKWMIFDTYKIQTELGDLPDFFPEVDRDILDRVTGILPLPILWSRDPVTSTPIALSMADNPRYPALFDRWSNMKDPTQFHHSELFVLKKLGIVVETEHLGIQQLNLSNSLNRSRDELASGQPWTVIRGAFPAVLSQYYNGYLSHMKARSLFGDGDSQDSRRLTSHNSPLMLLTHPYMHSLIQKVTPEEIKPSYSYIGIYRQGSVLPRHTDRPQCRWNMSVTLDTWPVSATEKTAWPIYVEDKDGRRTNVMAGVGDAVIYRGDVYPHGRDALPKRFSGYAVCFFHFVRSDFDGTLD